MICFAAVSACAFGQSMDEHAENSRYLRLTAGIQHTHIEKKIEGKSAGLSVAGWALDADYWFTSHLAMGFTGDILLENIVSQPEGLEKREKLEKNYPISIVPTVYYQPVHHISLLAGYGFELSREKDLRLFRTGAEYGIELARSWEVGFSILYDVKPHTHDSFSLGLGLSRQIRIGHHGKH